MRTLGLLVAALGLGVGAFATEPDVTVSLSARSPDGAPHESAVFRLIPDPPGPAPSETTNSTVELPAGSRWKICLELAGHWSPCERIEVEAETRLTFSTHPTGTISGRWKDMAEPGAPEKLYLRFSSPTSRDLKSFTVPCGQTAERWSCEVPNLGRELDLELRPKGFVPIYRFGLNIKAGEDADWGTLDLRHGASLVARVETADGRPLGDRARARLVPFAPRLPSAHRVEPAAESPVSAAGFVQLGAVEPGAYTLEVDHPDYARAVEYPLELPYPAEIRLQLPVVLHKPLTLEIAISPPMDWMGKPWKVLLVPGSDLSHSQGNGAAYDGPADSQGRVSVPKQTPGSFLFTISDSAGNPLHGESHRLVKGPEDARIDVDLELLVVRGVLLHGDEPVAGSLWFGRQHGLVGGEMAADGSGEFVGVLPRDGWWDVEVDVPELEVEKLLQRVEVVARSDGDGEVEVVLPDTELHCRTVDREGRPIAGAEVHASSLNDAIAHGVSDEEGEVTLRAFDAGPAVVGASMRRRGKTWSSRSLTLPVVEGTPAGPVELVLEERVSVSGRVVSDRGPVPHAMVDVATSEPLFAVTHDSVRTSRDGHFEAEISAEARMLQITVGPPGHALKTFRVLPSDPLELVVPSEGGTLRIARGGRDPDTERSPEFLRLQQDDTWLPMNRLWNWAQGHGVVAARDADAAEFPRLAPGIYRACFSRPEELDRAATASGQNEGGSVMRCAEGYLTAGGVLELAVELSPKAPTGR
ncbi:MAG: hypothetical protein AAF481_06235 [Acidobacteriota bacterium]